MNRAGTIVYLAAVGLLTAVLAALWLAPGPQARWRQWQAPAPQAPQLGDVQAAQLRPNPAATANYPGVVQRPLFSPDRRPVAAASAAAPAAPPVAIEQVRLQGLVAGPSLTGVMLEEQGKTRFVRVGETVADWKLERVQARAALFSRAGQQRRIELAAGSDASAAPVARPGGAAGPSAGASIPRRPSNGVAPTAPAAPSVNAAPVPAPTAAPPTSTSAPSRPAAATDRPAMRSGSFGGSAAAPATGADKSVR